LLRRIEHWIEQHPRVAALCRRDNALGGAWQVIGWWEARRVPYNLIVGIAGILSSVVIVVVGLGNYFFFRGDFPAPEGLTLFAVIFYAIAANLCFAGGWLVELIIRKAWPQEADRFATLIFSLGLIFSVLLTLTPAILVGVMGIFGLVAHMLGTANQ
jgi:hypothetical protein